MDKKLEASKRADTKNVIRLSAFISGDSITPFKVKKAVENDVYKDITNTVELGDYLKEKGYSNEVIADMLDKGSRLIAERINETGLELEPDTLQIKTIDDTDGQGYMIETGITISFDDYIKLYEDYIQTLERYDEYLSR